MGQALDSCHRIKDLFTKTTGLFIITFWLISMGWLVSHDVLPGVTAKDPPAVKVNDWLRNEGNEAQYEIMGREGPIGTIWTTWHIQDPTVQRRDIVWIDHLPIATTPMRVIVHSVFTAEGILDEFTLRFANQHTFTELHGERFHADFSFRLTSTDFPAATFKLPLSEAGLIAGAFNPFTQLAGLEVGDRWRMQVYNPVAAITGYGEPFIPLLVEVKRKESIATPEGIVPCFVVEANNARAWVDAKGVVWEQEINMPLVGQLRITRADTFDADAQREARDTVLGGRDESDWP